MAAQSELLIDRLHIKDFRQFEDLRIERLGRVNLIVGRNGVGKTSLLEAVRVLATAGAEDALWDIVSARSEQVPAKLTGQAQDNRRLPFASLFCRSTPKFRFHIESRTRTLAARLAWERIDGPEGDSPPRRQLIAASETAEVEAALASGSYRWNPILEVIADRVRRWIPLDRTSPRAVFRVPEVRLENDCLYVGPTGITLADTARLWDQIALTDFEDAVTQSLEIIYPGLVRISLTGSDDDGARIPRVKRRDYSEPVPLRTLGDGVNRLFGIALALVNARGGILLIDEIENGIHYSVQGQLWRFLIDAAEKFNVQVFATTHSTDAIRAFQWASKAEPHVDGLLTRIEERYGKLTVTQFDEEDLGIAVAEAIEVR
jgi:predicted ATPase